MRPVWTIAKREIFSFFASPLAYVVLTAWLVYQGGSYCLLAFWSAMQPIGSGATGDNPLSHFYGGTTLFYIPLLVFVPLLTMRLVAEEQRQGTIEPLLTAPVNELQVVLGKYLAAMVFWLALWFPTLMYVWLTSRFGDVDLWVVGSTFLGLLGVGAYYMSLGLALSAIAKNQLTAAVLTFAALSALFVAGLGQFLFTSDGSQEVFEYLSVWEHMRAFSSGIVDSRYLTFELTTAAFGVFIAVRILEARRYET